MPAKHLEKPVRPRFTIKAKKEPYFISRVPRRKPIVMDDLAIMTHKAIKSALLSHKEEIALAKRIEAGDEKARNTLVEANMGLVISVAKRYAGLNVPICDLIQEGNIGLIDAARKYDYRRNTRFGTYAVWWIRQSVTRAIASQARIIGLPEYIVGRINRLKRQRETLGLKLGYEPTVEDLAEVVNLPVQNVEDALNLTEPVSLDAPTDSGAVTFADCLEDTDVSRPEDIAIRADFRRHFEAIFASCLDEREGKILKYRFGWDDGIKLTLDEVGLLTQITRERVRQIELKALRKLRKYLDTNHVNLESFS